MNARWYKSYLAVLLITIQFLILPLHTDAQTLDTSIFGVSANDSFTFVVERHQIQNPTIIVGTEFNTTNPLQLTIQEGSDFTITVINTFVNLIDDDILKPFIRVLISNHTHSVTEDNRIWFSSFIINPVWDFWEAQLGVSKNYLSDLWNLNYDNGSIEYSGPSSDVQVINRIVDNSQDEFIYAVQIEREYTYSNSSTIDLPGFFEIRYNKITGVMNYMNLTRGYLFNDEIKSYELTFRQMSYNYEAKNLFQTTSSTNSEDTSNSTETQDKNDDAIGFIEPLYTPLKPFGLYIVLIILLGMIAGFVRIFWSPYRISLGLNRKMSKILHPLIKKSPALTLLLQSRSESLDTEVEKQLEEIVPPEIFQFKFLLHPVRLAITKLLYEKGSLSTIELKDLLGISSSNINKHVHALEDRGYIETEVKFIDASPRKVICLSALGSDKYTTLSNLLFDFVSK